MTLTFTHSLGGYPAQILTEIVAEYNQSHTSSVELLSLSPQDYASAAKQALSAKPEDRPHLTLAPEYMKGAMQQGLKDRVLLSVSSILDEDRLADIALIVSKTFGVDCLPFNPACGVLYINKNLLKAIELDPNWQPKTLEDLIQISKTIKQKTNTSYGYTCAWPEAYLIEAVLFQQDLSLIDEEEKYNFLQLKQHILDLNHLVQEGILLAPATGNYDPTRDHFIQGKVAFYMQGSGHATLIEKEAVNQFEVGYAPLPMLSLNQQKKYAFPLGGSAIWIFNTLPNEEIDVTQNFSDKVVSGMRSFLNYLASKEVQMRWHKETAYVPVNVSACEELKEFHTTHPLHQAVVAQTLGAPLGENSFGIQTVNYHDIRPKIYPLIHQLLHLKGTTEEIEKAISKALIEFQNNCNA